MVLGIFDHRSDHTKSSMQKFAVCVFTVLAEFMYG